MDLFNKNLEQQKTFVLMPNFYCRGLLVYLSCVFKMFYCQICYIFIENGFWSGKGTGIYQSSAFCTLFDYSITWSELVIWNNVFCAIENVFFTNELNILLMFSLAILGE